MKRLHAVERAARVILSAVLLTATAACGAAHDSDSATKSSRLTGVARECNELAVKRMRETGRSYNAQRSGWDEKERLVHVWIGPHLFRVPEPYVNVVNTGYPAGTIGVSAVLVASMSDMKPHVSGAATDAGGVERHVHIRLACAPKLDYASTTHTASRTRDDYLRAYFGDVRSLEKVDVPALGLTGLKPKGASSTLYFPKDTTTSNVHGGALAFKCDEPYPPQRLKPRPLCVATFALRDGVAVEYLFPEHLLNEWHAGYRNVVRLLNSFLAEK